MQNEIDVFAAPNKIGRNSIKLRDCANCLLVVTYHIGQTLLIATTMSQQVSIISELHPVLAVNQGVVILHYCR